MSMHAFQILSLKRALLSLVAQLSSIPASPPWSQSRARCDDWRVRSFGIRAHGFVTHAGEEPLAPAPLSRRLRDGDAARSP
jgi:hypothetical protein